MDAPGLASETWESNNQIGRAPFSISTGCPDARRVSFAGWHCTERMRITYNGAVEGSFASLPFGDGQSTTGTDTDASHYATLDHDSESDTEHAQFRQYSSAQGRWLSPDPYGGSYDPSNPQSLNRYAYAANIRRGSEIGGASDV